MPELRHARSYFKQVFCTAAFVGITVPALLLGGTTPARAEEHLVLVDKIMVGGAGLGLFDISSVNAKLGLYVLSDRTNASIDFVDSHTNTFVGRVGGFVGVTLVNGKADNALSGPDGNTFVGDKEVWAGDGDSTLKVIDIKTFQVVDTISTGGSFRVDEMSWDARDHILAAANNADTPPFLTLINTDTRKIIKKIVFDGTNGTPNATGGLEASQWSPRTGLFYVSVPQDGSDPAQGAMAVLDPQSRSVIANYPVYDCSPSGIALGPRHQVLLGCGSSFGTSPHVLTQSVILDIISGDVLATVPQVGGSDEVWYDPPTRHYYLASRADETRTGVIQPVLGTIDAVGDAYDGHKPTSTTAHSVAVDPVSHHVFVPQGFVPPGSPAGTDPTNPCPTTGCIAVYLPSSIESE